MRNKSTLGVIGFGLAIIGALMLLIALFIAPYQPQLEETITPLIAGGCLFLLIGGIAMAMMAWIERNND